MINLLKAKAFIHGFIFLFSIGIAILMIIETQSNIYPNILCYICAVIGFLNAIYSAWLLVDCNKAIEEIEER